MGVLYWFMPLQFLDIKKIHDVKYEGEINDVDT